MKFYRFEDAVKKSKKLSKREFDNLYIGESFTCTDVVAGEKCHNGGEYGFYTEYNTTTIMGIYMVKSFCTCDFDSCGTGFEGYVILTKNQYKKLIETSDRIEAEGSLYWLK